MDINFDTLPETAVTGTENLKSKNWQFKKPNDFQKQTIKLTCFGKEQRRLTFPTALVRQYNIDSSFKANFVLYETTGKLILILSKTNYTDADYIRAISPVGIGLFCTVIPSKLIHRIPNFPDVIWLQNTPQSTEEDIILEIYPG